MQEKKTEKADLEKKRGIMFQIGLLLALILAFCALNIKTNNAETIQTKVDVTGLEIELISGEKKVAKPPELNIKQKDVELKK